MILRLLISILLLLCTSRFANAHDPLGCPGATMLSQVSGLQNPGRFAINGQYAYVLNDSGKELLTIDISGETFQTLHTLTFDFHEWQEIVIHQNAAYLTDGAWDIQVINLTTPDAPTKAQIFDTESVVFRPVIIGSYMYAGPSRIYNVSNPLAPSFAGYMNLDNPIAGHQHGLTYTTRIEYVDLADPLNPVVIPPSRSIDGNDYTKIDIDIDLNRIYASYENRVNIIDIEDPTRPFSLYNIPLGTSELNHSTPRIGSILLANRWHTNEHVQLIDVSSRDLHITAPFKLNLFGLDIEASRFMQLVDGVLYVVSDYSFSAFHVQTNPLVAARATRGNVTDVITHDEFVLTAERAVGVTIHEPDMNGALIAAARIDEIDSAYSIDIKGDTLYVAAENGDLAVVDFTDPTHPVYLHTIENGTRSLDVRVVDDSLFHIDRTGGLAIYDISNPTNPVLRSSLSLPGWSHQISFNHNHTLAAVASGVSDTHIIDISDLDNPVLLSSIERLDLAPGSRGISTATFEGSLLYTPEYREGYRVWDVSNPATPQLLYTHDIRYPDELGRYLSSISYQIKFRGNQMLIANGDNGLVIFDNSDPASPQFTQYFDTAARDHTERATVRRLHLHNDYVYTAIYGTGIKFFDLAECTPCVADLNNDSMLNFFDVAIFIEAFMTYDYAVDFNSDGDYNFFDVSIFLESFLGGCP